MTRLARAEVFSADEVAIVHAMNRTVRRCFLLGNDPLTGQNYDHRKQWIDEQLIHQAKHFGIDLLCQAIPSNHFHLVLRSRPDVVATWDDTEVARRWLMLCPLGRDENRQPEEPTEFEFNSIRNNKEWICRNDRAKRDRVRTGGSSAAATRVFCRCRRRTICSCWTGRLVNSVATSAVRMPRQVGQRLTSNASRCEECLDPAGACPQTGFSVPVRSAERLCDSDGRPGRRSVR